MGRVSLLWFILCQWIYAEKLPIYIEDSHAGSFGFFAQNIDLDKSYTLVLFDAHSDASSVTDSDDIRKKLRQVTGASERRLKIEQWRNSGRIQPFNWIEPLMPNPISKVIWVAGDDLTAEKIKQLEEQARVHLDWKQHLSKRSSGLLAKRFTVTDWKGYSQLKLEGNIITSIDLDYFFNVKKPSLSFEKKWQRIIAQRNLVAVSFALSRPWLKDCEQANKLLLAAFQASLAVQNSHIQYEPFLTDTVDKSEMAKSYYKRGEKPPRFMASAASSALKSLWLNHRSQIHVSYATEQWNKLLDAWKLELVPVTLELRDSAVSIDGVFRVLNNEQKDVVLSGVESNVVKVRWWCHQPEKAVYNLLRDTRLGKGFTGDASPFVSMKKSLIATTEDPALAHATWSKHLAVSKRFGIVRLQAEIVTDQGSQWTAVREIRVRSQDGIRGAIEEQFGSPYVFGVGRLHKNGESGPETLVGNDCANFLIYAWRRNGHRIPWCNPRQLLRYLKLNQAKVSATDRFVLAQGNKDIIIHLGSHVLMLWQDRGVIGELDGEDLLVHHLSGFPEFITLSKALKKKQYFDLYTLKKPQPKATILLGGDIHLADIKVPYFSAYFKQELMQSDLNIANLEGVISDNKLKPVMQKRFLHQSSSLQLKKLPRFDAFSLANNHSGDFKVQGLKETIAALESANIVAVGGGQDVKSATAVKVIECKGIRVGLLALNMIEADVLPATAQQWGISTYPTHKKQLSTSIANARSGVDILIAMPHWGDEYTVKVNDEQRELAKWLIRQGCDVVVGSHTHTAQATEYYQGKFIAYSLGNLLFPAQNRPFFNDQVLLKLSLSSSGKLCDYQLLVEKKGLLKN